YTADSAACRGILERLGDFHAAHMDLAGALQREGDLAGAEAHALRALELDYPAPGLAFSMLACLAAAKGDFTAADAHRRTAARRARASADDLRVAEAASAEARTSRCRREGYSRPRESRTRSSRSIF